VIGDAAFLFQFVAPPPVQPRPQLPVAVLRGAGSIDWNTTIIAALSFLLHFMALGAIYSDWLDPVVDDEVAIAGLIDSLKNLPPPPPVEEQKEKAEPTEAKGEVKEEPKKAPAGPKSPAAPMNTREVARVSNELDKLEMATLGALSGSGPATAGVLRGGEVPTGALDQAAASGAGVGIGSGDLKLGSGGGAIRPGQAGGGLASIGSTGRGTEGTGASQKVSGPKGSANVGGAAVSGGSVSNAARVVAGMRAGFRACYQRGLNENPDSAGNIKLTIKVGPGGEVQGVSASPSGSLPASVVSCVQARAQAAQFDPPEGGTAVINVPVTFVKQ
jgi:outer membrane biosynthesis protein TonB